MATSGKVLSNALGVFLQQSGVATDYDVIAGCTSASLSMEFEQIDITTKDESGAKAILPGDITWSIQAEALVQYDTLTIAGGTATQVRSSKDLMTLFLAKTLVTLAWSTGDVTDPVYTGQAYITSVEESAGTNEVTSFSCTFSGHGAITAVADPSGYTMNIVS